MAPQAEKRKEERNEKMKYIFQSFASGSSGNCYYLGTSREGILIDAGIGIRTIKKNLKELGLTFDSIRAVLVTHDHADHIKAVPPLGNKYFIPIYTTAAVFGGINENRCIKEKLSSANVHYIEKEVPFSINGFRIVAFPVPHDATDSVGYRIETPAGTFCFLTDMGCITSLSAGYIAQATHLVIEANYDEEMLAMGPYPAYLKERIASHTGHMSNRCTARHLADLIGPRIYAPDRADGVRLEHIWLCHLSQENNHPDLALKTFEAIFHENGVTLGRDVHLTVLKRTAPSEPYEIEIPVPDSTE